MNASRCEPLVRLVNVLVAVGSATFGVLALLAPAAYPGTTGGTGPQLFAEMYGVRSLLIAAAVVWPAVTGRDLYPILLLVSAVQFADLGINAASASPATLPGPALAAAVHLVSAYLLRPARSSEQDQSGRRKPIRGRRELCWRFSRSRLRPPLSCRDHAGDGPRLRLRPHRRSVEGMNDETRMYRPGETVPESGIYECTCGKSHQAFTSTDVKGHTFPPPPSGCSGVGWSLKEPTHR